MRNFPLLLLFFLNEKSIYIYGKIGLLLSLQQHLRFLLYSLHTALSDGRDVRMFSRAIETKCRTHTPFSRTQKYTQFSFPLAWSDACKKRKIWQSVKFSFLSFQTFNVRSNPTPVIFEACWKTDLTFTFTHLPSPTPTSQKNREGIFRREHFFLSLSHSHKRLILNTRPTISRIATAANGPKLINPWENMWGKKKRHGVGKFRISRMGWDGIPKLPWGCDRLFLQKGGFSHLPVSLFGAWELLKKNGDKETIF